TSNIGAEHIDKMSSLGFGSGLLTTHDERYEQAKEKVMGALKDFFRPEFLNRLDETIIFHSLQPDELRQIVKLQVERLRIRLKDRNLDLNLTDDALDWVANIGYDPVYGARPLKRAIQQELETPIAKAILAGQISNGDTIEIKA
ncbi:MAG TPA: AAA family ATPase, partial [Prochlorococcaceae cyanobacterium AMR_MDS_5431]|nr:AAA family ATPase [Prochlorococcaceae cyanobacterium AMR_MDS_5431]